MSRPWPLANFSVAAAECNEAPIETVCNFIQAPLPFDMEDDGVEGRGLGLKSGHFGLAGNPAAPSVRYNASLPLPHG